MRPVFIDALNVAYWCGRPPSLRFPIALMAALMSREHRAVLYFDASARHQLNTELAIYTSLIQHARYVSEARSGIPADRLMLRHASSQGACVLSRDQFRDHRKRHRRLIDDPSRRMSGLIENDRLLVPSLSLDVRLPESVDAAWQQLEPLLIS